MKYVFLDVDGVLNNFKYIEKCYKKNGNKGFFCHNVPFDPKCLKRIAKVVRKYKAKIVLTSTWRLDDTSLSILNARLAEYGVQVSYITEYISSNRGFEIESWLNKQNFSKYLDDFIIIDDEISDIAPYFDSDKIIKTDFNVGFTWLNMLDAMIRLSD